MARKRKKSEGGGGGAAWMNTYADMVTLLLCFFVLLYSFSTIDARKFVAMAESMRIAFNAGGKTPDEDPNVDYGSLHDGRGEAERPTESDERENANQVLAQLQQTIKNERLEDEIKVVVNERGVVLSLSEQILFDEGTAVMHPEAKRILFKLGTILAPLPNILAVEGHTDSTQPVNSIYGNNWGLSAARAASVASYLNEPIGVNADRLRAVGLSSTSPLVPNISPDLMRLNRRVDIVILSRHSVR